RARAGRVRRGAAVAVRRRCPVAACAVAAGVAAVPAAFGVRPGAPTHVFALQPTNADLAIVVLLYTLAAHRPRRVSVAGLAICLAGSAVAIARRAPSHGAYAGGAVLGAAAGLRGLTPTPWVPRDSVAYPYPRAYHPTGPGP